MARRRALARDRVRPRAEGARASCVAEHDPVARHVEQRDQRAVAAPRVGRDAHDLLAELLAVGNVIRSAQREVQHVERVLQRLGVGRGARELDGFARDRPRGLVRAPHLKYARRVSRRARATEGAGPIAASASLTASLAASSRTPQSCRSEKAIAARARSALRPERSARAPSPA